MLSEVECPVIVQPPFPLPPDVGGNWHGKERAGYITFYMLKFITGPLYCPEGPQANVALFPVTGGSAYLSGDPVVYFIQKAMYINTVEDGREEL